MIRGIEPTTTSGGPTGENPQGSLRHRVRNFMWAVYMRWVWMQRSAHVSIASFCNYESCQTAAWLTTANYVHLPVLLCVCLSACVPVCLYVVTVVSVAAPCSNNCNRNVPSDVEESFFPFACQGVWYKIHRCTNKLVLFQENSSPFLTCAYMDHFFFFFFFMLP